VRSATWSETATGLQKGTRRVEERSFGASVCPQAAGASLHLTGNCAEATRTRAETARRVELAAACRCASCGAGERAVMREALRSGRVAERAGPSVAASRHHERARLRARNRPARPPSPGTSRPATRPGAHLRRRTAHSYAYGGARTAAARVVEAPSAASHIAPRRTGREIPCSASARGQLSGHEDSPRHARLPARRPKVASRFVPSATAHRNARSELAGTRIAALAVLGHSP